MSNDNLAIYTGYQWGYQYHIEGVSRMDTLYGARVFSHIKLISRKSYTKNYEYV
jgi:hypothetical protein